MILKNRILVYGLIAFLEGGAVMAGELIAGKMLAPYYGNSLYVWTSVIASTLGGLALGYYLGGKWATGTRAHRLLTGILLLSALLCAFMPIISSVIMQATLNISVQTGSLISCLVFIFPLLTCFGIVSPVIVRLVSHSKKEVGKHAGQIYAISTAGGVMMTFLMGFYCVPFLGLKWSAYLTAASLAIAGLLSWLQKTEISQNNEAELKGKMDVKKTGVIEKKEDKRISANLLLAAAFIEGVMVITVELLGAKMLTPLYGNSLAVWTSVLGVTIAFLALGYFLGGIVSHKTGQVKKIALAFFCSSLLILFMPSFAAVLFGWLLTSSVYFGVITGAVLLLGPPLCVLGMTSPLIIQQLANLKYRNEVGSPFGSVAGKVYAISTCGGILFTFLIGFYVLPSWGIGLPAVMAAFLLFTVACYLHFEKKYFGFVVGFAILLLKFFADHKDSNLPNSKTLYESEGLLGQLKVADIHDPRYQGSFRYLFINGIPQSVIINNEGSPTHGTSGWFYTHKIGMLSGLARPGKSALLLGIGGGVVAGELQKSKMTVDLVDLDSRMFGIASKYFHLNKESSVFFCDDGRHYLKTSKKQYSLIVIDIFNGEVQPSHMFTKEAFSELKNSLSAGGMVIFNVGERTKHEGISAYQSICNTLLDAGFKVYCNFIESEDVDDILIMASLTNIDFDALKKENVSECCLAQPGAEDFIKHPATKVEQPFSKGIILTDDRPMLDILNAETSRIWREWAIKTFAAEEIKHNGRLFK